MQRMPIQFTRAIEHPLSCDLDGLTTPIDVSVVSALLFVRGRNERKRKRSRRASFEERRRKLNAQDPTWLIEEGVQ